MAQDIVGGLFGMQQQPDYSAQDYRNAVAMAEMNTPKQMGRYLGGMIGAPVGRAVAQGVGGLLGVEDPRLQQAAAIKEAQQQGFDVTTPEGLQQLAQFFVQRGQPGLASQVAQQMQGMQQTALTTAKTQEDLQRGQQYRSAVAQLQQNPNATEQDYINLARQFSSPEAGITAAISAQARKDAAVAKAEADQLDFVTNAEGQPVGKFDKTGRFISTSGTVTPAKDYQAAKTEHEKLQDSLDTLLNISKEDIKNAFGTVNYTKIPGAGLLAPEQTYTSQNKINSAQIANVLDSLATMKGATSDAEMNWIKTNFPGYDASPATMEAWMNRSIKYLNKKLQRGEKQFGFDTNLGNPALFSTGTPKTDAKKADWMKRAASANPNATQQELSDYYDQNKK